MIKADREKPGLREVISLSMRAINLQKTRATCPLHKIHSKEFQTCLKEVRLKAIVKVKVVLKVAAETTKSRILTRTLDINVLLISCLSHGKFR